MFQGSVCRRDPEHSKLFIRPSANSLTGQPTKSTPPLCKPATWQLCRKTQTQIQNTGDCNLCKNPFMHIAGRRIVRNSANGSLVQNLVWSVCNMERLVRNSPLHFILWSGTRQIQVNDHRARILPKSIHLSMAIMNLYSDGLCPWCICILRCLNVYL